MLVAPVVSCRVFGNRRFVLTNCQADIPRIPRSATTGLPASRSQVEIPPSETPEDEPYNQAAEQLERMTMADLFDLEKQFAFYGAYHHNTVNVLIHCVFVWPIFLTALVLPAFTPQLVALPLPAGLIPGQQFAVLNWSFVFAAVYALYYVALDKKAGTLAAALCLCCWIASNAIAQTLGFSLAWKVGHSHSPACSGTCLR